MAGFKRKLRRRARKILKRHMKRSMPRNMVLVKSTTSTSPVLVQTSAVTNGSITYTSGVWVITPSSTVNGLQEFSLSTGFCLQDLTNDASYVALYQLYKIKSVTVRVLPFFSTQQVATAAGGPTSSGVILHSAPDPNDAGTATVAQLQRYKGYKRHIISHNSKGVSRTIKPRIDMDAQTSGSSSLVYNMKAGWISTGSIDVDHNALKMCFEMYAVSGQINTFPVKIELTYNILFKDPQ